MKKMDVEKKAKLIYSGELLVFALIFLVVGILKFTKVMGYDPTRAFIFNIITIAGSTWGIIDFIWAISSKKRRPRISLIDKILILPLAIYMITFDLICFIAKPEPDFYIYMIGGAFMYITAIYLFESIYHYFRPIPGLLDDDEDEENPGNSAEKPEK